MRVRNENVAKEELESKTNSTENKFGLFDKSKSKYSRFERHLNWCLNETEHKEFFALAREASKSHCLTISFKDNTLIFQGHLDQISGISLALHSNFFYTDYGKELYVREKVNEDGSTSRISSEIAEDIVNKLCNVVTLVTEDERKQYLLQCNNAYKPC